MTNNPRERLVSTTALLLQSQGYNSTGLNQILQESGVPKGSLYHYFPGGKEELALAAITHASAEVDALLRSLAATGLDMRASLVQAIGYFIQALEGSDYKKGCPIATVSLEQAGANPQIQAACAQAYATWQATLAEFMQAHGCAAPRADVLAERLLMLLEGALVLCKARRDCSRLRHLQHELDLYLQ
jgi:TetR/AcrR family transcriptional repressor of lmrAB and yxaGH operons